MTMPGFEKAQRAYDNASPPEPYWVGEENMTCGKESERKVITPDVAKLIADMADPTPSPWKYPTEAEGVQAEFDYLKASVVRLKAMVDAIEETDLECSFEGKVDVAVGGDTAYWTCPVCGEDHEEDARDLFERDPDDEREARLERDAEDRFGDLP